MQRCLRYKASTTKRAQWRNRSMIKNGRTFREDVKIVRRGLKEFDKILHGQMRHIFAKGILVSCISYIPAIIDRKSVV